MVNVLLPRSIPSVPTKKTARLKVFLQQCQQIGVVKAELFEPIDLIQQKNMVKVIYCLHSLAELCHQNKMVPFFTGVKNDRLKQRNKWKENATKEGWVLKTALLQQIKEQPSPQEKVGARTSFSVAPSVHDSPPKVPLFHDAVEEEEEEEELDTSPEIIEPVQYQKPVPLYTTPQKEPTRVFVSPKLMPKIDFPQVNRLLKGTDNALIRLMGIWFFCVIIWGIAFYQKI